MKEIFKFINIQSISGESEKPLFFRKSFEDGKGREIEKWCRKLCTLNYEYFFLLSPNYDSKIWIQSNIYSKL